MATSNFPILLVSGTTYNVTITAQPTGRRRCVDLGNTGNSSGELNSVQSHALQYFTQLADKL